MTKSTLQIASEIVEAHPQASRMQSAHKMLLASMIAEELKKQMMVGYTAGFANASQGPTIVKSFKV